MPLLSARPLSVIGRSERPSIRREESDDLWSAEQSPPNSFNHLIDILREESFLRCTNNNEAK